MMLAVLFAAGGLTILGLILGARWLDATTWRRRLVAYQLRLPAGLAAEQVSGWLGFRRGRHPALADRHRDRSHTRGHRLLPARVALA